MTRARCTVAGDKVASRPWGVRDFQDQRQGQGQLSLPGHANALTCWPARGGARSPEPTDINMALGGSRDHGRPHVLQR